MLAENNPGSSVAFLFPGDRQACCSDVLSWTRVVTVEYMDSETGYGNDIQKYTITHTHTHTHTHTQMDKQLPVNSNATSRMAGFLCTKQELWAVLSNLLEPGQVLAGAPTAMPTVVWTPEVPPGSRWLRDFVAVGGLCHPRQRTSTHLYS